MGYVWQQEKEEVGDSQKEIYVHWQNICVKNIGVGLARKVEFGGELSFKTKKSTPLKEIGFIESGIDALPPGGVESERVYLEWGSVEKHPLVLITVIRIRWVVITTMNLHLILTIGL